MTKLQGQRVRTLQSFKDNNSPSYQLLSYQVSKLPNYQFTIVAFHSFLVWMQRRRKMPIYQFTKLPSYQVTKLPNYKVIKLSIYQVIKLQSYQVTNLSPYLESVATFILPFPWESYDLNRWANPIRETEDYSLLKGLI